MFQSPLSCRSLLLFALQLVLDLAFGALAQAAEPARVQLAAYRVNTVVQEGVRQERLQSLEQLRPGDVIEYEATYSNAGRSKVGQVMLTVPVPDGGLVYVKGGAQPAQVLASLDGQTYAPMPLQRAHTLPDGRQVMRAVPLAEIRFLRWNLGEVEAGGQRVVRARMQLPALPTAPVVAQR